MTASVGDLLDRLHQLAYRFQREPAADSYAALAEHWQGWRLLADRIDSTLGVLPFEPGSEGDQVRADTRRVLHQISAATGLADGIPWQEWRRVSNYKPLPALAEVAEVVGGIGDVLASSTRPPFRAEVAPRWRIRNLPPAAVYQPHPVIDPAACGIQSSLLAAVYALARRTLDQLPDHGKPPRLHDGLRLLAAVSEPHALLPIEQRQSALELLTAIPGREPSLVGAVQRWSREVELALHRQLVTSGTFAMTAGDLTILNAALAHTLKTHTRPDELGQRQRLQQLIGDAYAGWKQVATWPAHIRLGGTRSRELIDLSRQMRAHITEAMRGPEGGWLETDQLLHRHGTDQLDLLGYTLARHAARAGEAVSRSLQDMTVGQGRLWRRIDSALALDPTQSTTMLVAVPNRTMPVKRPWHWVVSHDPGADLRALVDTALAAAAHNHDIESDLSGFLTGTGGRHPEAVPGIAVDRNRLRALPALTRTPSSSIRR